MGFTLTSCFGGELHVLQRPLYLQWQELVGKRWEAALTVAQAGDDGSYIRMVAKKQTKLRHIVEINQRLAGGLGVCSTWRQQSNIYTISNLCRLYHLENMGIYSHTILTTILYGEHYFSQFSDAKTEEVRSEIAGQGQHSKIYSLDEKYGKPKRER